MSKDLKQFLRAWLWWVMTGAVSDNPYKFNRGLGLCWASVLYRMDRNIGCLGNELKKLFWKDGLDSVYPFGEEAFEIGYEKETMHLCPKRVGWVIKVLEENPDA